VVLASLPPSYRPFIKSPLFSPSPRVVLLNERGNEKGFHSGDFIVMLPVSVYCNLPLKWDVMVYFFLLEKAFFFFLIIKKPAGVLLASLHPNPSCGAGRKAEKYQGTVSGWRRIIIIKKKPSQPTPSPNYSEIQPK